MVTLSYVNRPKPYALPDLDQTGRRVTGFACGATILRNTGCGYVLRDGGERLEARGFYLAQAPTREAEYEAIIRGIEAALNLDVVALELFIESRSVIRQLQRREIIWDGRTADLRDRARQLLRRFRRWSLAVIPGDENEASILAHGAAVSQADIDYGDKTVLSHDTHVKVGNYLAHHE